MGEKRSVSRVIITNLISLIIFLIILSIIKWLVQKTDILILGQIVELIRQNLLMMVGIWALIVIAELFNDSEFPFVLASPLISSLAGLLLAKLIIEILVFLQSLVNGNFLEPLLDYRILIYLVVFAIVIIGGYIRILIKLVKEKDKEYDKEEETDKGNKKVGWSDVGEEFKKTLVYFFKGMRDKKTVSKNDEKKIKN